MIGVVPVRPLLPFGQAQPDGLVHRSSVPPWSARSRPLARCFADAPGPGGTSKRVTNAVVSMSAICARHRLGLIWPSVAVADLKNWLVARSATGGMP